MGNDSKDLGSELLNYQAKDQIAYKKESAQENF